MHGYIRCSVRLLAVPLLLTGVVAGISPVTAAAARTGPAGPAASFTVSGHLSGVAATSAPMPGRSAVTAASLALRPWSCGGTAPCGRGCPGPPRGRRELLGVAATSARNAWAVGCTSCFTSSPKTLILRWNGTAWKRVSSPSPAGSPVSGVAAVSASSAWAVGYTGFVTASLKTLILRWNGKVWKRVSSPSPGASSSPSVLSVAVLLPVTPGRSANCQLHVAPAGLILQWNGKEWRRAPSPVPTYGQYGNALQGVAAISTTTPGQAAVPTAAPLAAPR